MSAPASMPIPVDEVDRVPAPGEVCFLDLDLVLAPGPVGLRRTERLLALLQVQLAGAGLSGRGIEQALAVAELARSGAESRPQFGEALALGNVARVQLLTDLDQLLAERGDFVLLPGQLRALGLSLLGPA